VTATTIEVFHKSTRVATHARSNRRGGFTTVREHMPPAHQSHARVNEEMLLAWADQIGPNTAAFVGGGYSTPIRPPVPCDSGR